MVYQNVGHSEVLSCHCNSFINLSKHNSFNFKETAIRYLKVCYSNYTHLNVSEINFGPFFGKQKFVPQYWNVPWFIDALILWGQWIIKISHRKYCLYSMCHLQKTYSPFRYSNFPAGLRLLDGIVKIMKEQKCQQMHGYCLQRFHKLYFWCSSAVSFYFHWAIEKKQF